MPKKPRTDKKTRARIEPPKAAFRKAPSSINDLLHQKSPFRRFAAQIPEQQAWSEWLRCTLPPELAAHIVNVVPKAVGTPGARLELVVLADSPAWCARLRFAIAALDAEITARDAAVQRTRVRVALR